MFGFILDEIEDNNNSAQNQIQEAKRKVLKRYREIQSDVPRVLYVGPDISDVCSFSSRLYFGTEGSFRPDYLVASSIMECGQTFKNDIRMVPNCKLDPITGEFFLSLYPGPDQIADITPYIHDFFNKGVKDFYIYVPEPRKRPMSYRFSIDDFVILDKTSIQEDAPSLCQTLSGVVKLPAGMSTEVVLKMNKGVSVLKVQYAENVTPPIEVFDKKGSFGGKEGYWVTTCYNLFDFEFFLTEIQRSSFSIRDWAHNIVNTLLKNRYVLSPCKEIPSVHGVKFKTEDLSSLESCHLSDDWICDTGATHSLFEKRSMGLYNPQGDHEFTDYIQAHTTSPYCDFEERCKKVHQAYYPCGVCPKKGSGKYNKTTRKKKNLITNFNFGITAVSSSLCAISSGMVVVTKPSYGVSFLKYKSVSLLPIIFAKVGKVPPLCDCSYGVQCDTCEDVISCTPGGFVKSIPYLGSPGEPSDYGVYKYKGRNYVVNAISEGGLCNEVPISLIFGSSREGSECEVSDEILEITKDLCNFYEDYISGCTMDENGYGYMGGDDPPPIGRYFLRSSRPMSRYQQRFLGALSIISSSSPYRGFTNAWVMITMLKGKRTVKGYSYDKEESLMEIGIILSLLQSYDKFKSLDYEKVEALRDELGLI